MQGVVPKPQGPSGNSSSQDWSAPWSAEEVLVPHSRSPVLEVSYSGPGPGWGGEGGSWPAALPGWAWPCPARTLEEEWWTEL